MKGKIVMLCAFVCVLGAAQGTLFGVTGQAANVPQTLHVIEPVDGSAEAVLDLDDGGRGEALAYGGDTKLLYHWSGDAGSVAFQSIDPITYEVVQNFPASGVYGESIAAATEDFDDDDFFLVVDRANAWYTVDSTSGAVVLLKQGENMPGGGDGGGGGTGGGTTGGGTTGGGTTGGGTTGGGTTGGGTGANSGLAIKGVEMTSSDDVFVCLSSSNQLVRLDRENFEVQETKFITLVFQDGRIYPANVTGCNGMTRDRESNVYFANLRLDIGDGTTRVLASLNFNNGVGTVRSVLSDVFSTIAFADEFVPSVPSVPTATVRSFTGNVEIETSSDAVRISATAVGVVGAFFAALLAF